MLLALNAAVLDGSGPTFAPNTCTGKTSELQPATTCLPVPAVASERGVSERVLAQFVEKYVGPAHGIERAELGTADGGKQQIVVYVMDWNGIINIPNPYLGMTVFFTQSVPKTGVWQL